MTPEQRAQLWQVNEDVNQIHYNAVMGVGEPPDFWTSVVVKGWSWVCRMFAEMKADRLKALGWSTEALWTVLCYTEPVDPPLDLRNPTSGRERHAVLAVRLPGETWVLDSRTDEPYRYGDPNGFGYGYLWEGEQLPDNAFITVWDRGLTVLPA